MAIFNGVIQMLNPSGLFETAAAAGGIKLPPNLPVRIQCIWSRHWGQRLKTLA